MKIKFNPFFFLEIIQSTDAWMVGNFHHRGFYRVNYNEQGWRNIQQKLNSNFDVRKNPLFCIISFGHCSSLIYIKKNYFRIRN